MLSKSREKISLFHFGAQIFYEEISSVLREQGNCESGTSPKLVLCLSSHNVKEKFGEIWSTWFRENASDSHSYGIRIDLFCFIK